ncbi:hypothetical protein OQA88_11324 [Cercophora sp. LCS_1]
MSVSPREEEVPSLAGAQVVAEVEEECELLPTNEANSSSESPSGEESDEGDHRVRDLERTFRRLEKKQRRAQDNLDFAVRSLAAAAGEKALILRDHVEQAKKKIAKATRDRESFKRQHSTIVAAYLTKRDLKTAAPVAELTTQQPTTTAAAEEGPAPPTIGTELTKSAESRLVTPFPSRGTTPTTTDTTAQTTDQGLASQNSPMAPSRKPEALKTPENRPRVKPKARTRSSPEDEQQALFEESRSRLAAKRQQETERAVELQVQRAMEAAKRYQEAERAAELRRQQTIEAAKRQETLDRQAADTLAVAAPIPARKDSALEDRDAAYSDKYSLFGGPEHDDEIAANEDTPIWADEEGMTVEDPFPTSTSHSVSSATGTTGGLTPPTRVPTFPQAVGLALPGPASNRPQATKQGAAGYSQSSSSPAAASSLAGNLASETDYSH